MTTIEYFRVIDELVKYTNNKLIESRGLNRPSFDEPVNSANSQIFRDKLHSMNITHGELCGILQEFLEDEEIMNKFDITDK